MRFLRTRRHSEHYKWWVLTCTSLGMLLATVNSGTLIIALPDLERSLHTTILQLVWVILVYMIVSTVLVLTAGRLSDLFGRKHAYVLGFVIFSVASLGAGFSGSGTQLILWRVLQGVGGAFLFANAAALVTDAFPKKQLGLAMGTNTMVAAVGLVIGPVLGGALVAISWPWVFWFNLPFGIAGSVWAYLVLHDVSRRDEERGLDLLGTSAYVVGLTADRRGSRGLAALGMVVTAAGLAGMTMLQAHTAYVWSALWLAVVGIGSGMFMSPNTAAMMGSVPDNRRGVAAGARVMLQNTGAVISIAFVMAIVTAAVPQDVLFKIFSGLTSGLSTAQLDPFISNMHLALWVLAVISLVGAAVSMLRPAHVRTTEREPVLEAVA